MEDKKTLCKGSDCGCNHKSIICWLVGFLVLMMVFCAGYKLGQWKAYFHAYQQDYYGYQAGGMMRWKSPGYGMMRGWGGYPASAPTQLLNTDVDTETTSTIKE
ncbi:MAG: hypothetical protein A2537_02190 [Candidatus Magasanikbacteria bacterium RIFOXYD2_FULL_36_9]|uniref:Uncharacterized protein n=1 Tax=Candidatus Magasanikbacteria bacterium RIFOXYD2_FULL_36_9 TaxID=1798707 RepID=A0A1F6P099_9BACT|nr:MAG: hypothetical protein A2537_02190 [Candidatus Magasanikbacteria bacterium RIFOXYD2_FULL_36_9]